ncbi:MAG: hypothetical protein H6835_05600 [Planctomycetes bacterium]|nr:hypothetical protein [Planctomycetota bacterium]
MATTWAIWASAGGAAGQRVVPVLAVEGATATAVGVLWEHGFDDDEGGGDAGCVSGASRVLAECRLLRARAAAPRVTRSGCAVGGDYTLVFGVAPAGDAATVRDFVAALLDDRAGRAAITDDELRLVVARAALAADDDEFHYPGAVLETIARRRLFAGAAAARAPSGDAAALAQLAPDDVRQLLRQPHAVRLCALGVVDDALRRELQALQPPSPPSPPPRAPSVVAAPAGDAPPLVHTRVDAPFVMVAFAVGAPSPQLALGVEVAKERARRRWKVRGSELLARAPLVRWSWAEGDPLLQFCRRGEDPEQLLPGQVPEADCAAEAAAAARELELLLADLRDNPPRAAELAAARASLQVALGLPAPGEATTWASQPALLPGRLQALLLRDLRGIDLSAVATATPTDVHEALRAALDPSRRSRQTLLPQAREDYGFRRR